jgi:four helix bundle protein
MGGRFGNVMIGDWVIAGRFGDLARTQNGIARAASPVMSDPEQPQPHTTSVADELQTRTQAFAVATVKFCRTIVTSVETQRIKSQLIAASTSMGANYRAAPRARSRAEFTAKIGVVAEEADESAYWLDLAIELQLGSPTTGQQLYEESVELMKIFGKSSFTARSHRPDC